MRPRILILPVSAIIITALCAYKLTRTEYPEAPITDRPALKRPAPTFELLDEHKPSRLVRLDGYLGRYRILLVFFNGDQGADRSPVLLRLRDEFDTLESAGIKVFAVSAALPQDNRKIIARSGPFPFPLLSDPAFQAYQAWGRLDETTGKPLEGVFFIDRAGLVEWSKTAPKPSDDPQQTIEQLLHGR